MVASTVAAGVGVVSAKGLIPVANNTVMGNVSGVTDFPVAIPISSLTLDLDVGTSTITGGAATRILYDNAGVLGEYTISGSGTVVAMATSPVFTTPTLGVAIGTSLALGGATIGANGLAVTGTTALGDALTITPATANTSALVLTGGTVTALAPLISGTRTWNNAGVTFTAALLNITDTASNSSSLLLDLQKSGVSQFNVSKSGAATALSLRSAALVIAGSTSGFEIDGRAQWRSSGAGTMFASATNADALTQLQVSTSGSGATVIAWANGTGSPEGAVTARIGSYYSRLDGGAATSLYVKESGTGNTGWVAVNGSSFTTISTAAPAGSSAGLWKLGALEAGAVVLDTTRSIFVDIGGVVYKLMVAQ